ncbi:ribonuclease H family protein [Streptomyces mobaraensis]|uniref:Ribonuclease H n=1 Tax=Streptomyces mobaraensis TaxID=35621 RepID=A0A5N5WEZ3_STRMB|nr:ribonuclease H [Streptomyces mobaraensis]KAB7852492.1 ribonuclease HI [Streptomyces mobaraensis]
MLDRIIAACDGASKGNPGPAAWAWVAADAEGRPERWEAGPLGRATNNIAELTALRRLLEATDPAVPVEVRLDSQYAMNAVTKWLPGWKRNGWKTAAGKPVANQDLVRSIDALLTGREVEFRYVPAHRQGGDPLNAIADQAASDAAVSQRAAGTAHGDAGFPVPDASRATAPPRPRRTGGTPGGSAASGAKGARSRGTLKAKFPGRCVCGKSYAAGEQIAKNQQGWGHAACRTDSGSGPSGA